MSETPETTHEEMSPLRRSVVSGVKWGTASAGTIFVLGLVQTATLAHLLTPNDFGLMAAAAVVLGLARSFADLGLSSAIVARQIRDHETLSSLYWASLIAGLAMFGIVLALMPLMVRFYRQPELYHIIPWAALSFVIIPIGQQFQMILQMDLQVERLVKVDVASAVIALLVAVGAALAGAGPLALVFGYLARAGVTSLLFAIWGWKHSRPSFRLRRSDLHGYISFGLYQMGERTANFLSANVDYLLVGRYLGLDALGAYSIAYQLVVKPVFELNPISDACGLPGLLEETGRRSGPRPGLPRGHPPDRVHHRPDDGRGRRARAGDRARPLRRQVARVDRPTADPGRRRNHPWADQPGGRPRPREEPPRTSTSG